MSRAVAVLIIVVLAAAMGYFGITKALKEPIEKKPEPSILENEDSGQQAKTLEFDAIQKALNHLDEKTRAAVLSDPKQFKQFIQKENTRAALLEAAETAGLHEKEGIRFLMQRKAEEVLVNAYIRRQLALRAIPKGFPSREQVSIYYEKNKRHFIVPERIPVWQIFWKIPENATEVTRANIIKEAAHVSWLLKKGKKSFADAAWEYSQHEMSRVNGGFLGIVRVNELRPAIKDGLLLLKPNLVSEPIQDVNGVHIFQRGKILVKTQISLDQARPQVVKQLKKAYRQRQTAELRQNARDRYTRAMDPGQIEQWRSRMMSNIATDSATK